MTASPTAAVVVEEVATEIEIDAPQTDITDEYAALIAERRHPDVPPLPFADNPDPDQCGIPIPWGADNDAWLSGEYDGELIQPTVLLYDSHLRLDIAAEAPHGAAVEILLFQENPSLDYYLVKIKNADTPNEGWVPAPFLSFEPVAES